MEYHNTRPAGEGGADGGGGAEGSGAPPPPPGGVSFASREEQERLFAEAEARYEEKLRRGGSGGGEPARDGGRGDRISSLEARYAAGGEGAGGGGGGGGSGAAASRELMEAIGECMHHSNEAYLDLLMRACSSLPIELEQQIRQEVQTQLEAKVRPCARGAVCARGGWIFCAARRECDARCAHGGGGAGVACVPRARR